MTRCFIQVKCNCMTWWVMAENYECGRTSTIKVNSLWPHEALWWHRYGSTFVQLMAFCLKAPSHHLSWSLLMNNQLSLLAFHWQQFHWNCSWYLYVQSLWLLDVWKYCYIFQLKTSQNVKFWCFDTLRWESELNVNQRTVYLTCCVSYS